MDCNLAAGIVKTRGSAIKGMNKILEELNQSQLQAVTSLSSIILVLAGAGTGKTKTLVSRVAYLHQEYRVGCVNMCCLTFTRLAARELKERASKLIGEDQGKKLTACTLHAFAVQVLKEWGFKIGIEKNFTIYDQEDRDSILKQIIADFGGKTTVSKTLKFYLEYPICAEQDNFPAEFRVIKEYQYRLRQNNAVDLDKLVPTVVLLWSNHPDALQHCHQTYSHVFIDEFQDTSIDQMEMIRLINPQNLFAVGDDYQSLYSWRGAVVDYIIDFDKPGMYPGCEVIKLEDNYRSTYNIVTAANRLISYNVNQTKKTLIAHKDGPEIIYFEEPNEFEESYRVLSYLNNLKSKDISWSNMAILARTNAQVDYLKIFLDRAEIPALRVSSADDLFKKHDIKYLIYWLDFYCNRGDSIHIKQAISFPRFFLTELRLKEIEFLALNNDLTFFEALKQFPAAKTIMDILGAIEDGLIQNISNNGGPASYFKALISVFGIKNIYDTQGLKNRIEDAERAYSYMLQWEISKKEMGENNDVYAFLKWLRYRDIHEKFILENQDAVRLMTIHGAKGLEFEAVFVVGMNQDVFPSKRTVDPEEERRLCYVALTRAKKYLYLSRVREISGWGGVPLRTDESQYIKEALG